MAKTGTSRGKAAQAVASGEWDFASIPERTPASWGGKGESRDSGASSRAKKAMVEFVGDDSAMDAARKAYNKVCAAVAKLGKAQRQAACFAAAAMHTWDAIAAEAREGRRGPTAPRLTKSQETIYDRIKASKGQAAADTWREMTLLAKGIKNGTAE